jgi:hypothetical protein
VKSVSRQCPWPFESVVPGNGVLTNLDPGSSIRNLELAAQTTSRARRELLPNCGSFRNAWLASRQTCSATFWRKARFSLPLTNRIVAHLPSYEALLFIA